MHGLESFEGSVMQLLAILLMVACLLSHCQSQTIKAVAPTLSVLNHDGGLSVIRRNGTARATVTPLAPTTYVVTNLVHLRGAPGLQQEKKDYTL